MFLKGKKKFGKLLSKMGLTRGAGSIERMDVLSRCSVCGDSETSSLDLSVASDKSEVLYKIHVSIDDGGESFFMVSDLKELSDITKKVLDRYPAQNPEDIIIKYYDGNVDQIEIKDSKDFEIFMVTHIDNDIYISWRDGNVASKNTSKKQSLVDMVFPGLCPISKILFVATCLVLLLVISDDLISRFYPRPEKRLDQWAEYKKIIKEFCQGHTAASLDECQNIIVDFLSFMSFDSLAHGKKLFS